MYDLETIKAMNRRTSRKVSPEAEVKAAARRLVKAAVTIRDFTLANYPSTTRDLDRAIKAVQKALEA